MSVDVVEDLARGVAYSVPQSHTFQFDERLGQVTLTAPRGSTTFRVQKVEQREGETVYRLGANLGRQDWTLPRAKRRSGDRPPRERDRRCWR
jgi:hypothetical protein